MNLTTAGSAPNSNPGNGQRSSTDMEQDRRITWNIILWLIVTVVLVCLEWMGTQFLRETFPDSFGYIGKWSVRIIAIPATIWLVFFRAGAWRERNVMKLPPS